MSRQVTFLYLGLLLAAAFLMLTNLSDRLLWGDEAETALLAANITKYGIPLANDGVNRITLLDGADLNEQGVWIWSPWLDEYLAAGSFLLLGKTTLAARLPFVLFGIASIMLVTWLAWRIHGTHAAAATAAILLMSCVPFLLHARQCRYYPVLAFAQIWLLCGLQQLLDGKSVRGAVQMSLALIMQFYCNYIVMPGNVLTLLLTGVLFYQRVPRLLTGIVAALAGLFLAALPWLLYAVPRDQLQAFERLPFSAALIFYLFEINFDIIPWVLLLLPIGVALMRWCRHQPVTPVLSRCDWILWLFIFSHLITLSVCPLVFFRYLMPLIPVLILLATSVLERCVRPAPLRYAVLAVLASSNLVGWATAYPVRGPHRLQWTLPAYVHSVTTTYTDRCEDMVSYLARASRPGESVYVADHEFPLIFYTGLRVMHAGYFPLTHDLPDWFLPISPSAVIEQPHMPLPEELQDRYRPITLTVHASPRGCRRPDPHMHEKFTATRTEEITIYRKLPKETANEH